MIASERRALQRLLQTVMAGVVSSVADHNQDLLVGSSLFQMRKTRVDGVIKRRHADRRNAVQSAFEFRGTGRKQLRVGQSERNSLVEVDHEHLIARVARLRKGHRRGRHVLPLPRMLPLLSTTRPTATGTSSC